MSITPDIIFERKKLKKLIIKWKLVSLLVLLVCIFSLNFKKNNTQKDYIARITVEGIITEDSKRASKIKKIADDKNVKAIIVKINSPGGTAYGGEELYYALRYASSKKPTTTIIGTLGASGGYMAALGCDYIFASNTTLTGSVGVLLQSFDARNLLIEKLGITPKTFKTSELKAAPSPFDELTPAIEEAVESTLKSTFSIFKNMVKERRRLTDAELESVSNGKVFTGKQALDLKLVDAIGYEDDAISWLEKNKDIPKNILVKDLNIDDKGDYWKSIFIDNFLQKILLNTFPKFLPMTIYN